MDKTGEVHFHSSDDRFCGSKQVARRFSLDENEVSCPHCKAKDGFVLSQEGREYLRSIGYEA
jgi:hypothetical protein